MFSTEGPEGPSSRTLFHPGVRGGEDLYNFMYYIHHREFFDGEVVELM